MEPLGNKGLEAHKVGIPRGDAQRVRAQSSDCGEWAMCLRLEPGTVMLC